MKWIQTACLVTILLLSVQTNSKAQVDRRPFNPLAESVESAIKEQFPDWKRTSIPPAQPNGSDTFTADVLIDQWKSDKVAVNIAILIHPSVEEAKKAFREFVASVKTDGQLQDAGSESSIWGLAKSVVFRKGRYTVYVSAAPIYGDGELRGPRVFLKEAEYSKTFAQIVSKTLKDLN